MNTVHMELQVADRAAGDLPRITPDAEGLFVSLKSTELDFLSSLNGGGIGESSNSRKYQNLTDLSRGKPSTTVSARVARAERTTSRASLRCSCAHDATPPTSTYIL